MKKSLYLAGNKGLYLARKEEGSWNVTVKLMEGTSLTSVVSHVHVILAGTEEGLLRSFDNGKKWERAGGGLAHAHVRWVACAHDDDSLCLAGTEPASIFLSLDGGKTWVGCPEVEKLRDSFGWYLPYSPEAGCIRGFAFSGPEKQGRRIYAAAEVGGVLLSENGGVNWNMVAGSEGHPRMEYPPGMIHPDVHSVTVHPRDPDLVTAATGGGLYRSRDGGASWSCLYRCYCRAAWVDPADPGHIVFGPADGVSRGGRIEESRDGGETWIIASTGMEIPWRNDMVERFHFAQGELFALLARGEIWSRDAGSLKWRRHVAELDRFVSISTA